MTNTNPGWISIDLPLTAFTCISTPPLNNCPNNSDFVQFVITSDLGTVYYDNLYLHKNTVLGLSSFAAPEVKMYPNPASDRLTIESTIEMQTIEVSNLLGQEIMRVSPAATVATIDISSLQSGVYFVKTVADGLTLTKRFIKK